MRDASSMSDYECSANSVESRLNDTRSEHEALVADKAMTAEVLMNVADAALRGAPSSLVAEDRRVQQRLEERVLVAQERVQRQIDALRVELLREAHGLAQEAREASSKANANANALETAQFKKAQADILREEKVEHLAIAERFDRLYEHLTEVLNADQQAHECLDSKVDAAEQTRNLAEVRWAQNLERAQLVALAAASVFDPDGRGRLIESVRPIGLWNTTPATGFYEPGGRVTLGNPSESMMIPTARAELDNFGRVWQVSTNSPTGHSRHCIGRVAQSSGTIYFNVPGTDIERPAARFFAESGVIRVREGGVSSEWSGAIWSRIDQRGDRSTGDLACLGAVELPNRPIELARVFREDGRESRIVMMPLSQLSFEDNPIQGGWGPGMSSKGSSYEEMREAMCTFQERVVPELLSGRSAQDLVAADAIPSDGRQDWQSNRQLLAEYVTGDDPIAVGRTPAGDVDIIGGRHRIQVARDMGYTHVPVRLVG
jgi:hypothetical protein